MTEDLQKLIMEPLQDNNEIVIEKLEAWVLSHEKFLHRPNVLRMLMPFREALLQREKIKQQQDFCAQLQSFII